MKMKMSLITLILCLSIVGCMIPVTGCDVQFIADGIDAVDGVVQDVNTVGSAADALMDSEAGTLLPLEVRLGIKAGSLAIAGIAGFFTQWKRKTKPLLDDYGRLEKVTKSIVRGIDNAGIDSAVVKGKIKSEMISNDILPVGKAIVSDFKQPKANITP